MQRRHTILAIVLAGLILSPGCTFREEQLVKAWRAGDHSEANRLLDAGLRDSNLNAKAILERGYTVLHAAAGLGRCDAIRRLVKQGADLEAHNSRNRTPLILACGSEQWEDAARLLVELGADVNADAASNGTPLSMAAATGNLSLVKFLIEHGATAQKKGTTLLHTAVGERFYRFPRWSDTSERVALIEYLVGSGIDVNARDAANRTPLHLTARDGTVEVAAALIKNSADIEAVNRGGETPLYATALRWNTPVAKVLLEKGASIKTCHKRGTESSGSGSYDAQYGSLWEISCREIFVRRICKASHFRRRRRQWLKGILGKPLV